MAAPVVTRIGDGAYRVEENGLGHLVYVAGTADDCWAFASGQVFRSSSAGSSRSPARRAARPAGPQTLTAPMPATVLKILVPVGATVKKGQTIVLLEAMKMELPLRAPADAVVNAIHCREGELVQPEAALVELS